MHNKIYKCTKNIITESKRIRNNLWLSSLHLIDTADKISFHSVKVIRSPSDNEDLNEDLFKIFPSTTNPDGILFDILDQQRVRAESILS